MKMRSISLLCVFSLLSGIVHAEVYEWMDQNGRSHYSDRQHENSRLLKVDPGTSYYRVERVFDGDTILLSDGRKIRFLGVNTPEVAGRNKLAETGGEQAKTWLKRSLEGKKVSLQFDVEKEDKYHRTLAYVFAEDKRHINLELVERGLATVNIYPPNLKFLDVLLAAQSRAEKQKLGIWAENDYTVMAFKSINEANYKGWKRVSGRVVALKQTDKYSYLQFSSDFEVKVENNFLPLFPNLHSYIDKQLEVRGWINKQKQRFVLLVRHPADIKILSQ
jgi:endonuclease YncB( thermonuclease family)